MGRIQIIAILGNLSFLIIIARLILKGKLREEYAIIWVLCTLALVLFSFWRNGLEILSRFFGVYAPPNMVFIGAIIAILVYLLHLSIVVSKLHDRTKIMSQEIALLKEKKQKHSDANQDNG